MKKYSLGLVLLIVTYTVKSQIYSIDSLKNQLESAEGIQKIDILNQLMKYQVCRNGNEATIYFESIINELQQTKYIKGDVECTKNYGTLKYCSGDLDSALYFYVKAAQLAQSNNLKKEAGAIYNNIGLMHQLKGDFEKSLSNFGLCYNLGESLNDTLLLTASLNGIGDLYRKMGRLDSALHNFLIIEKMSQRSGQKNALLASKMNIALIYFKYRTSELNHQYLLDILNLSRELNDIVKEASILQLLGAFYYENEDYVKSLGYLNEGLEVIKKTQEKNVTIYLLQGIGNVYFKLKKYEQAIAYNNQGISLANKSGLNSELLHLHVNNASNFVELKRYREAIESCKMAISYSSKTGAIEYKVDLYKHLAKAYNGIGSYKKAFEAQVECSKLSNDYRDLAQSDQLREVQTKYETEKKEAEIASLSQQAAIQTLQIRQKNQGIIIGIVVLLLVLTVAYFVYKQRSSKREKEQTELEQRFLRSQLNPHFISNALVAVQNYMLKNQPETASIYLTKFSKLMREILENSRKEFIPVEDEIEMLTNYMDIHKLRMNDAFDYHIEIDANIDPETDTIPPMFVQPFIENAIEHGIVNASDKGLIEVNLIKEREYISIEVKDNGGGIIHSSSKQTDHNSLSSKIIQERMALFNKTLKNKIQLILENIKNESGEIQGTKVELKVPFGYV